MPFAQSTRARRALRLAPLLAALALPGLAQAQAVTFVISQTIGNGSVTGEIVTSGASGVLASNDIISWNLLLKGGSASTTLNPGNSVFKIGGSDLTGNGGGLYFNFSGSDGGYMLVQTNLFSGAQYWCNNTSYYACNPGASVTPQTVSDPSFQSVRESGNQLIGKAMSVVPLSQLTGSIGALANTRTGQMISNQTQTGTLLGGHEQVSCGNCGGGGITLGSFAINSHGRVALGDEVTLLLGGAIGEFDHRDAHVAINATGAAALRYDPAAFGDARPYVEAGGSVTYDETRYRRSYMTAGGIGTSLSKTHGTDTSAYLRAGFIDRLSKRDEFAFSGHVTWLWQHVGGYAELADSTNPFNATLPAATDRMTVAGIDAQYTHLFGRSIELGLNGGIEHAFNRRSGIAAHISNLVIGANQPGFDFYTLGARIGIRVHRRITIDLIADTAILPHAIGTDSHAGGAVRIVW